LKLPVKTTSSATVTLASMKSCGVPSGSQGVDRLQENGAAKARKAAGKSPALRRNARSKLPF
jgi:hypothetical protein